jgi:hypothetical protein
MYMTSTVEGINPHIALWEWKRHIIHVYMVEGINYTYCSVGVEEANFLIAVHVVILLWVSRNKLSNGNSWKQVLNSNSGSWNH